MRADTLRQDQHTWKPWFEIEDVTGECEADNTTEPLEEQSTENQTRFKCPSWQYFTYYLEPREHFTIFYEPSLSAGRCLVGSPANAWSDIWEPTLLWTNWASPNAMFLHSWETSHYGSSQFLERINQKARTDELLDSLKSQAIIIPQRSEVCEYLVDYPGLLDILPNICKSAHNEFSKDAQLSLEIYSDPEIDYRYITIYVRQKEYTKNILERIRGVRTEYSSMLAKERGRILITTDFDDPL